MNTTAKKPCVSCGVSLNAGAQFCHACGTPQRAERKAIPLPLIVLTGFAIVVVVAIVAYNAGRSAASSDGGAPFASSMGGATAGAPDISSLSPREQADRLFEIVMTAHEQGDFDRVSQFASMALQAYDLLGPLDADAHYHVGLMSAITGDAPEALARVDSIRSTAPNHLLATMLRNSVAQMQGDSAMVAESQQKFLEDYETEMATDRLEYQLHERAIENFKARVEGTTGGM